MIQKNEENPENEYEKVIADYLDAVARGEAPSRPNLLRQHPGYEKELSSFFGNLDLLREVMGFDIIQMLSPNNTDDGESNLDQPLIRACQSLHRVQGNSPGQLKAWLRTFLKLLYFQRIKDQESGKRDRRERTSIDETSFILDRLAAHLGQPPNQSAHDEERRMKLYNAILDLDLDPMSAVILVHLKGLSTEEAGRILGKTRHSIGGLVARGLSSLKKALGDLN